MNRPQQRNRSQSSRTSNGGSSTLTAKLSSSTGASTEMLLDMLIPTFYPTWRAKVLSALQINHLDFTIDPAIAPYVKLALPPMPPTMATLSMRLKLDEIGDKKLHRDQAERASVYNDLFNCIPYLYRENLSK